MISTRPTYFTELAPEDEPTLRIERESNHNFYWDDSNGTTQQSAAIDLDEITTPNGQYESEISTRNSSIEELIDDTLESPVFSAILGDELDNDDTLEMAPGELPFPPEVDQNLEEYRKKHSPKNKLPDSIPEPKKRAFRPFSSGETYTVLKKTGKRPIRESNPV